jgi:hypothetical protein
VTSLNNQLFVVRRPAGELIEVYDTATFTLQRNISVPGLRGAWGSALTACAVNNCLYVADCDRNLVFRVAQQSSCYTVTKWSVCGNPYGVSVNNASNVLVTCNRDIVIREYTTHGSLIREISVGISFPCHSIQLPIGLIAISCSQGLHVIDNNGTMITVIDNYTDATGTSIQFSDLRGLASLNNGCALVAGLSAHQVLLLNPSFSSSRVLRLPDNGRLKSPTALFFDESRGRLYVGEQHGGRVLVFDNVFNVGSDFQ